MPPHPTPPRAVAKCRPPGFCLLRSSQGIAGKQQRPESIFGSLESQEQGVRGVRVAAQGPGFTASHPRERERPQLGQLRLHNSGTPQCPCSLPRTSCLPPWLLSQARRQHGLVYTGETDAVGRKSRDHTKLPPLSGTQPWNPGPALTHQTPSPPVPRCSGSQTPLSPTHQTPLLSQSCETIHMTWLPASLISSTSPHSPPPAGDGTQVS